MSHFKVFIRFLMILLLLSLCSGFFSFFCLKACSMWILAPLDRTLNLALWGKVLTTGSAGSPRIALNTTVSHTYLISTSVEEAFSTFVRLSIMKMKSLYRSFQLTVKLCGNSTVLLYESKTP